MSDVIRLLPDSVANQIAAGEVIQRPASVIKELVENSIDAGATIIKVILRDAGKTLIQVVDDGCGMSPTDARLAFERHATSKIVDAKDLFALHTMGFRGEALPSIVAVAQVDIITQRASDTVGTHLSIAASKVEKQEPCASAPGTNISVKNLFFNFPARRKFLKKDSVELTHIIHEFERLALVNPGVELHLIHNDATLHQLPRASLKQRIGDLFGRSLEKQIIPVETETTLCKISGFVGLPENARKRNQLQYFFVNGRNMRHPYFHKAVMSCYEQLIPSDHFPNYFIAFEVDPSTIDVNIHPTKSEIKFENEQPIWQILAAAIREALGRYNVVPSIEFDTTDRPDIPTFSPNADALPSIEVDKAYNPFRPSTLVPREPAAASGRNDNVRPSSFNWRREFNAATSDWDKLYQRFDSAGAERKPQSDFAHSTGPAETSTLGSFDTEATPTVIQLKNKYILSPSRDGLMVVDQYRAHVRVLYDRFLKMAQERLASSQQVIFPEQLVLTPAQRVVFESIEPQVRAVGFDFSKVGENVWEINGVPAPVSQLNSVEMVENIISTAMEETETTTDEQIAHVVALAMARSAAIKGGQVLSGADMELMMSDLFKSPIPNTTPDGNPTFIVLTLDDIAKKF